MIDVANALMQVTGTGLNLVGIARKGAPKEKRGA
jgi:hypothetical protein